jgi:hypothetical protein
VSLDTITTLAGQFQSNGELQIYCDAQYITLQKAQERIKALETENKHLQTLIAATQPLVGPLKSELIVKSTEQTICEMEIEKLKTVSMNRSLTLEETKRLDLLVKNLLLAKGLQKDILPDYRTIPSGFTESSLVAIAAVPELPVDET